MRIQGECAHGAGKLNTLAEIRSSILTSTIQNKFSSTKQESPTFRRGECQYLLLDDLKTSSNNSDAALTGEKSTRTGLVSPCRKTFPLLNVEHGSGYVNTASLLMWGTLLHTLKDVVSATPAPQRDL